MKRLSTVLILALALMGCAPGQVGSWPEEINRCISIMGPNFVGSCYAAAGFTIHQHCQIIAYREFAAATVERGVPSLSDLEEARANGFCAPARETE